MVHIKRAMQWKRGRPEARGRRTDGHTDRQADTKGQASTRLKKVPAPDTAIFAVSWASHSIWIALHLIQSRLDIDSDWIRAWGRTSAFPGTTVLYCSTAARPSLLASRLPCLLK